MQIGAHFLLGFRGPTVPSWLRDFAAKHGLGGVILFDYDFQKKAYQNNVVSREQLKTLCREIHALDGNPAIYIDQEGGKVRRLKEGLGFKKLVSHESFAALPVSERKEMLRESFAEMKELGIDVNLAPVIDINYNAKNPDIGAIGRSFSARIDVVRENADLFFEASEATGLGLCLKHYPGLGGATVNSHEALTDLSDALHEEQLALFLELGQRAPILFSHGIVKSWDAKRPVSISEVALQRVRAKLPDTVFISDDLQMQGLQKLYNSAEGSREGLRSELDVVIIGNNLLDEEKNCERIATSVAEAAKTDSMLAARLTQSAKRLEARRN